MLNASRVPGVSNAPSGCGGGRDVAPGSRHARAGAAAHASRPDVGGRGLGCGGGRAVRVAGRAGPAAGRAVVRSLRPGDAPRLRPLGSATCGARGRRGEQRGSARRRGVDRARRAAGSAGRPVARQCRAVRGSCTRAPSRSARCASRRPSTFPATSPPERCSASVSGGWCPLSIRRRPSVSDDPSQPRLPRVMGLRDVVLFNITAIVGLRWLTTAAQFGPTSLLLWMLAMVIFFLPSAAAVRELADIEPGTGGIYRWVTRAFGPWHGFVAGWGYWVNNMLYFPSLLVTTAAIAAYAGGPGAVHLEDNRLFVGAVSLAGLWIAVVLHLVGLRF